MYHLFAVIDESVDFAVSAYPFTRASAGNGKGVNGVDPQRLIISLQLSRHRAQRSTN